MTVNTVSNRIVYQGDGATTVWTFTFPAVDQAFLKVSIIDSFGNITILPPSLYIVTLNPTIDPNPTSHGGSVQYPISGPPLAVGNQLMIVRELPFVQDTSIANQSIIYPPVIEQEFDYLTMLIQTGIEDLARAFRVGPTDPIPALVPPVVQRRNTQAIFDNDGNLTGGAAPIGVLISAVMIPVVTATTLPLARAAMGVPPIDSPVFTGDARAVTPPPGDNDTSIATTAFVQALFATSGSITGDLKPTHRTTADPGWIMWIDGTIGDPTSGSTIRANADTQALFTLYYNSYTDANCPLRTSANGATTRVAQGTAATAFAAHCRMTLPRGSGRKIGIAGNGVGLTPHTIGSFQGSETVVQTEAQLAPHTHTFVGTASGQTRQVMGAYTPVGNMEFQGPDGLENAEMQIAGSGDAMNVMNPCTYINVMIKL